MGVLKVASIHYIGQTSDSNGLASSKTTTYSNTISYDDIVSGGAHLRYNSASNQTRFRYYKSATYTGQKVVALYKLTAQTAPTETPADIIGFTATDSKASSYVENSVFDTANGLSVVANKSDGTSVTLAASEYTYEIFDSSNTAIDTSKPFGAAGTYTLRVSYGTFIPQEIPLTVGEYVYLTGLTAHMTTTEFTTADVLANNLAGNLVANLTYNYSSYNKTNVAYSDFASNSLVVSLYNPSDVACPLNSAFNVSGTWTLKITCSDNDTLSQSISLTVSAISATSVTLSHETLTIEQTSTATLTATVSPSNATNKSVTWSSDNETVASVNSNGLVTGLAIGTANITATAKDGSGVSATCKVTVVEKTTPATTTATITVAETFTGTSAVTPSVSSFEYDQINVTNISSSYIYAGDNDNEIRFSSRNNGGSLTFTFEAVVISHVKLYATVYGSDSPTITVTTSANTSGQSKSLGSVGYLEFDSFNNDTDESTTLTISSGSKNRFYLTKIELTVGVPEPIYPTSISLSGGSHEIGIGKSTTLSVSYTPTNTNQKNVTWSTSNADIATVNNGVVKGVASGNATITAKALKENGSYATATFDIIVNEAALDAYTIMIYMCGADLESENQLATGDIEEILSVSGQPEDVNIIIETGGASSWSSKYGISSSKLERWHVRNKSLVKDDSLTYESMGLSSTFQSFLEWGLTEYPAQKTGVILWNHGGGMWGVCYDEKKSDDSLLDNEVKSALDGAFSSVGRSEKLTWIGYDACLMQLQDVAEFNSGYFNYMVGSQESEAGYGWDYDTWVDDLYAGKDDETIFKAIVDGFIEDNGGVNGSGSSYQGTYYPCD